MQFGILQYVIEPIVGQPVNVWREPAVVHADGRRCVTIWWTNGFSILLFLAGLRNIPQESTRPRHSTASSRWQTVPEHHLAADLAGDGAVPDHPAHPAAQDLRSGLPVLASAGGRRRRWCSSSTSTSRPSCRTSGGYARDGRGGAVRHRHRVLAAAIPGAARAGASDERRARRRIRANGRQPQPLPAIIGALLLTILTIVCRRDLVLPALLGDRHQPSSPRNEVVAAGSPAAARSTRPSTATSTTSYNSNICRLVPQLDHHLGGHHLPGRPRWRPAAATPCRSSGFPGRMAPVVDHPGELHGPGAGADREPLHHHGRGQVPQHLSGHRPAAAHRAGDGDRLQAVLRFRAARISRGGRDRRRQRIPAAVLDVPADELGRHRRARHHHLHRRLELVPVAVPRRQDRGHDDRHGRHHRRCRMPSASTMPD